MKHYPGRTVEEIMALASDIREDGLLNSGCYMDIVEFSMLPAAEECMEDHGDCDVGGYTYSTVIHCGPRIAYQLETLGYVDIT